MASRSRSAGPRRRRRALLEAFDGFDKPDIAFADEVIEWQPVVGVVIGDLDDQPKVGPDHHVTCLFVALGDTFGKLHFLWGSQQVDLPDLLQIKFDSRAFFRGWFYVIVGQLGHLSLRTYRLNVGRRRILERIIRLVCVIWHRY